MTAVTVHVTAGHITRGMPGEAEQCPVALAIRDAIPGLTWVSVGTSEITLAAADAPDITIAAPVPVMDFVTTFDHCGDGEPFTFTLYPDHPDGDDLP
jgi:hypothetical protein